MTLFSSQVQLVEIEKILRNYIRLPFSDKTIPGAVMEAVLAHVRGARVLKTYDFVDVVQTAEKIGWQVKSTKDATPVTWKRAKIPNATALIQASNTSKVGAAALGKAIIDFCNKHAEESLNLYKLEKIGYSRLIIHANAEVTYFERTLCTKTSPQVFDPNDFTWSWSVPKKTKKKEQLPALHGVHKETGKKWWAWHGLGENQLHFTGEKYWWPQAKSPNRFQFGMPAENEKISLEKLMIFLAKT